MREFNFQSSSGPQVYATRINDNGLLSCDCKGWTTKKEGKVRECKHTKEVAREQKLALQERDGQWFVVDQPLPGILTSSMVDFTDSPEKIVREVVVVETEKPAENKPGFVQPMLASKMPDGKSADDYANGEWVMEEKFDGHRIVVVKSGGPLKPEVKAWSRLGNRRTLPLHIERAIEFMPDSIYDGELMVPGMHSYDVVAGQNAGLEVFVLFDILAVLEQSVMKLPQQDRHALLKVAYDHIDGVPGVDLAIQHQPSVAAVQEIWQRGGEGAILKRLSAPYRPGWRSPDWVKVKSIAAATLTVVGYQAGESGPYSSIKLRDDAGIETTVKTLDNRELRAIAGNPEAYVGRRLVISYQERTPSGKYRHPMFDHWAGEGE